MILNQPKESRCRRRFIVGFILLVSCLVSLPAMAQNRDDIALELIGAWEGKRNYAYLDIADVPTICYGSTRGVKLGDYKTDRECKTLLIHEIAEYRSGLFQYFTPVTEHCRMTDKRDAAYTSLAYNVGIRAAGKSTATRRLNKGDIAGGCEALTWWNKARVNGTLRRVRGLVNRRNDERRYCLEGL